MGVFEQLMSKLGLGQEAAKQMIVVRKDLKMSKGKVAAQASHACIIATLMALEKEQRLGDIKPAEGRVVLDNADKNPTPLSNWFNLGMKKVCVSVNSEEELLAIDRKAKEAGLISAVICDAGYTEFSGVPTITCLALEPQTAEKVDPLTGDLPLY